MFFILLFNTVSALASPPAPKIYSLASPYTPILPGQEIFLKAYFSDPDTGEGYSIKWDMGDGTVRTKTLHTTHDAYANPGRCSPYRYGCFAILTANHAYDKPGSYSVSLIVTDSKEETGIDKVSHCQSCPQSLYY